MGNVLINGQIALVNTTRRTEFAITEIAGDVEPRWGMLNSEPGKQASPIPLNSNPLSFRTHFHFEPIFLVRFASNFVRWFGS